MTPPIHNRQVLKQRAIFSRRQMVFAGISILLVAGGLTFVLNFSNNIRSLAADVSSKANGSTQPWIACSNPTANHKDYLTLLSPAPSGASLDPFGSLEHLISFPVAISSFRISFEQNFARLDWTTSSEVNSDHFEVERSLDEVQWQSIAAMAGHGTTLTRQDYTFIDHDADVISQSYVYYRLKQVDDEGKAKYSESKKLFTQHEVANDSFKVWYSQDESRICCSVEKEIAHPMQATLINIIGQVMGKQYLSPKKGELRFNFNVNGYANGIYSVILESDGNTKAMKVIKD